MTTNIKVRAGLISETSGRNLITGDFNGVKSDDPGTVFAAPIFAAKRTTLLNWELWFHFDTPPLTDLDGPAVTMGISGILKDLSASFPAATTFAWRLHLLDVDWDPTTLTFSTKPAFSGRFIDIGPGNVQSSAPVRTFTFISHGIMFDQLDEGPFFGIALQAVNVPSATAIAEAGNFEVTTAVVLHGTTE